MIDRVTGHMVTAFVNAVHDICKIDQMALGLLKNPEQSLFSKPRIHKLGKTQTKTKQKTINTIIRVPQWQIFSPRHVLLRLSHFHIARSRISSNRLV